MENGTADAEVAVGGVGTVFGSGGVGAEDVKFGSGEGVRLGAGGGHGESSESEV
jgi:hypothetical protein